MRDQPAPPPRLQVVVAHPDDETFGCGSVLLHAAAAGAVTAVCCATRGEAGEPPDGADLTLEQLGALRAEELRRAASLLGVQQVDLPGLPDSGMRGVPDPSSLAGLPLATVVAAVRDAVAAFAPDVLVTLDASDGHRDHARIRDAVLLVADELDVPAVYLQCLPRSLMRAWVEHMRVERPDMAHLDADADGLGTPDEDITTTLDATAHLPAREEAIAAHSSQTSPFEGLPTELRRAFLGADHLKRVRPAWTGGPPEDTLLGLAPARVG
jgi:LmbE family N-acetylglucosaminyl deacetylase